MFGLAGGLSGFATNGPSGDLFEFNINDSFTFTNCGKEGRNGPTIAQMTSHYESTYGTGMWWSNTNFLDTAKDASTGNEVKGVQMMSVPVTGTYRLTLQAPRTKYVESTQRRGVKLAVDVPLVKGEKIYVVVGQQGEIGTYNGGGSGGTFVFKLQNYSSPSSDFELIAAAGGAGGQGPNNSSNGNARTDANTGESGKAGTDANGSSTGSAGGSSGNAGSASTYTHGAAPGAGWLTTSRVLGTLTTTCSTYPENVASGLGLLSSVVNGRTTVLEDSFSGGFGYSANAEYLRGGFGGAGGGSGACNSSGSGGGGGYSGGGVGNDCCDSAGGGGGSYINTTLVTSTHSSPALYDSVNGYVTIGRVS